MNLRFTAPPLSKNGLGNQFFCWAKAVIAAEVLGARALPPAWSRNPRGYRRVFRSSRFDWEWRRLLEEALPGFTVTEEDFKATGS
jgi:hypothetical protein